MRTSHRLINAIAKNFDASKNKLIADEEENCPQASQSDSDKDAEPSGNGGVRSKKRKKSEDS